MFKLRWSDQYNKILVWLVIIGLLASLPLAYGRWMTERSSDRVEVVFDYSDLVVIASYQPDPQAFIKEHLEQVRALGVHSLAVYESTLMDLRFNHRIQLYNAGDAALLHGQAHVGRNSTYVLFDHEEAEQALRPIIEEEFAARDVAVEPWEALGLQGLKIDMAYEQASIIPMAPDPITLNEISGMGFTPVVRLSNNRPFNPQALDTLLAELKAYGTKWIVFSGEEVTGYKAGDQERLGMVAELMNKHEIGFAVIEMSKIPQKGVNALAYMTDYRTVRLHSLLEANSAESKQVISDRLQLAVKDRDIRMLFLNAEIRKDTAKATYKHTLGNLYESLKGADGAFAKIESAGYTLGGAEPFKVKEIPGERWLKILLLLGAVALIALLIGQFFPVLMMPAFLLGVLGAGGLSFLSSSVASQALALGAAISSPTLGVIWAVNRIKQQSSEASSAKLGGTIALFVTASVISLSGALYIIGLLNHVTYMLVLEQFRGVTLLHLAPIGLIAIYIYFFSDRLSFKAIYQRTRKLLLANIKVIWVVLAGVGGVAILYYLSRTGNEGQASALEMNFRAFLENTLGVRPRTKEFLLAHPLFIAGLYFAVKYKYVLYLAVVGVIGQLSMVDTFAHIHSPIDISFIRGLLGLFIGLIIGVILIIIGKWLLRSWERWGHRLSE